MADTRISGLTEIPALAGGDVLPIVDATDVATKKVAISAFDSRYLLESDVAAKGDLLVATANDTVGVLSVGVNDTVLTADSATATGVKWAAPSITAAQVADGYVAQDGAGSITAVSQVTQATFNGLTPDANTLYVIVG